MRGLVERMTAWRDGITNPFYHDIASVLVAVVIAVYLVTIIIPLIMTQISGASLSGFPTGTSTIFTTLLPVLVLLGAVYLVWKLISEKSGL